tara:strand:- start:29756 stop:30169 length:414 start_codon:yes stop_codon:yes gene_type:complete
LKGIILDKKDEIISAIVMLLSVAKADDTIENNEIETIKNIVSDFFQIDSNNDIDNLINTAKVQLNNSIDIFEFGKELNDNWNYQDKIDFICCMFEVSLSDGDLYYMEEHMIKKISTILNVNHKDLINAKIEMKKIFN